MKNLGSLILGLIIGAVIMYFYCSSLGEPETMVPDITIIKPKGVISPKEAIVLDTTYNSRHELISKNIVKRPDNRSSWWSIDDINNYITYAKSQADTLGYELDGLRVYAGAYPEVKGIVGYTTMFIVPTGYKKLPPGTSNFAAQGGKNDIQGGDPLNEGSGGYPPNANYPQ